MLNVKMLATLVLGVAMLVSNLSAEIQKNSAKEKIEKAFPTPPFGDGSDI